ncbi:hypothetical protein, partial [Curvivirga aplysinae]|uniref:hypothetical protein n=1 Tax=Curvivirga aplysinae TaxID=2529852 RepID=UPI001C3FA0DD
YLVAILIPWLALFLVGKPFQAIFNLILWLFSGGSILFTFGVGSFVGGPIWLICVIHAVLAVAKSKSED